MTRRPKITDPTAGQYQVVVSFRYDPGNMRVGITNLDQRIQKLLSDWASGRFAELHDLDVAVRVIGAQGERSMHENPVGLTEDIPAARTVRDRENIQPRGKYL